MLAKKKLRFLTPGAAADVGDDEGSRAAGNDDGGGGGGGGGSGSSITSGIVQLVSRVIRW